VGTKNRLRLLSDHLASGFEPECSSWSFGLPINSRGKRGTASGTSPSPSNRRGLLGHNSFVRIYEGNQVYTLNKKSPIRWEGIALKDRLIDSHLICLHINSPVGRRRGDS
jgi:hypothetical protein